MSRIVLVALLLVGCGPKASVASKPQSDARTALAKQIAAMSREDRATYFKQHPEAVSILTGENASPRP